MEAGHGMCAPTGCTSAFLVQLHHSECDVSAASSIDNLLQASCRQQPCSNSSSLVVLALPAPLPPMLALSSGKSWRPIGELAPQAAAAEQTSPWLLKAPVSAELLPRLSQSLPWAALAGSKPLKLFLLTAPLQL